MSELCNAGYVFVFDDKKVSLYKHTEKFSVNGKIVAQGMRNPRTGLYPISFYRKEKEKKAGDRKNKIVPSLPVVKVISVPELFSMPLSLQKNFPLTIGVDGPIIGALLAKSYRRPDLSDLDRWHAKMGDVGIKYMKRCLPSLKIPKQYRCDICIGKIHKFGHKACEASVRKIYLPGVCIHSDHSGPYAKSISSARYSQFFLDRGSGYLWAFRQKKKTENYATLPQVFLDSWALSSRKVQIFQSDGEGVFTSAITREILDSEKVRHEWSAPYDSDTNSFIERARRTIFEGVCTALIRSGAPARFWGEAENHKIYTINILPTLPDPEKENLF